MTARLATERPQNIKARGSKPRARFDLRNCPSLWPTRLAVGLELEVFVVCAVVRQTIRPYHDGSPVLRSRAWAIRNFGRHSIIKRLRCYSSLQTEATTLSRKDAKAQRKQKTVSTIQTPGPSFRLCLAPLRELLILQRARSVADQDPFPLVARLHA